MVRNSVSSRLASTSGSIESATRQLRRHTIRLRPRMTAAIVAPSAHRSVVVARKTRITLGVAVFSIRALMVEPAATWSVCHRNTLVPPKLLSPRGSRFCTSAFSGPFSTSKMTVAVGRLGFQSKAPNPLSRANW